MSAVGRTGSYTPPWGFSRPWRDWFSLKVRFPALKRQAIISRPCGTGQSAVEGFSAGKVGEKIKSEVNWESLNP